MTDAIMLFRQAVSLAMRSPDGVVSFITPDKKRAIKDFCSFLRAGNIDYIAHYSQSRVDVQTCRILFYQKEEDLGRLRGLQLNGCIIEE